MCGICGAVAASGAAPGEDLVRGMAGTMVHRGPDDEGVVSCGRACIAARRLSIIDVEGGHQPIANEDQTVWCALNGEIYNHPELIRYLQGRGHRFRSRCDTEVIVHLYEEHGVRFLDMLDGMFALALWDARQDTLLLARDRLGIKPLYVAELGETLLFASELKALLAAGLPRAIDLPALEAYLALSYVPAPHTIFRSARKLPPGHYLLWKAGSAPRAQSYWQPPLPDAETPLPPTPELAEELLRLLRLAVRRHVISDVPLGAFLSGGLDSSAVVALMAEHASRPVQTFSVGFDEPSFDETPHARAVAERFGTDHHELRLAADPVFLTEKLSQIYDEPFADPAAMATYAVAGLARRHVTVALSGDGGDEAFGGYLAYRAANIASLYRRLPSPLRDTVLPTLAGVLPASERKTSLEYRVKRFLRAGSLPPAQAHLGWRTVLSPEARRQLLRDNGNPDVAWSLMRQYFELGPPDDAVGSAIYADIRLELPDDMLTKVDGATMAVSLEARVPLLDRSVVEFMARLPSSMKVHRWELKYLFRRAVRELLPEETVKRGKSGFNLPIARWLRGELRDLTHDALAPTALERTGLLDGRLVAGMLEEHESGRADRSRELWTLLTLALWYDRVANQAAGPPGAFPLRSAEPAAEVGS